MVIHVHIMHNTTIILMYTTDVIILIFGTFSVNSSLIIKNYYYI